MTCILMIFLSYHTDSNLFGAHVTCYLIFNQENKRIKYVIYCNLNKFTKTTSQCGKHFQYSIIENMKL